MEHENETDRKEEKTNDENDREGDTAASSQVDTREDEDNEEFETAIFTLATFAAVFALYICIVYNLSSPPMILRQC